MSLGIPEAGPAHMDITFGKVLVIIAVVLQIRKVQLSNPNIKEIVQSPTLAVYARRTSEAEKYLKSKVFERGRSDSTSVMLGTRIFF